MVPDKAERVFQFHRHTVTALAEVVAAAGLEHPSELRPWHIQHRLSPIDAKPADHVYHFLKQKELLEGVTDSAWRRYWKMADADSFLPRMGSHMQTRESRP